MWPTYRTWCLRDGETKRPDLARCRRMLAHHMPELVPTYERLVELNVARHPLYADYPHPINLNVGMRRLAIDRRG